MKKILAVLFAVLLLTACGGSKEEILKSANSEEAVILKNGKTVYTEGDYIDSLQYADNTQIYIISALITIAEKEGIDVVEEANEQIDYIKEMLGDYYETYVINNSGSVEFYERSVKADVAYNALLNNYVTLNIESLANDLGPRQIQLAKYETEDEAVAALTRIKAGEQFDVVCFETAGEQDTIKPYIITEKDSTLDTEVKEAVLSSEGLTDVIAVNHVTTSNGESTTTTSYYIANVLSTDYKAFEEDFVTAAAATVNAEDLFALYFGKYNFEMFNKKAYLDMRNNYPSLLAD